MLLSLMSQWGTANFFTTSKLVLKHQTDTSDKKKQQKLVIQLQCN